MWARGASLGLSLLVVALSAVFAHAFLFTTFRIQDDEGYFLFALRAYRAGRSLYGEIDTIYGPFYFEAVGALTRLLHIPLDNVGARWFVLGVWILSCLGLARYVQRLTESRLAGTLAYFLAFPLLNPLVSAPLHPVGLILLLLSALLLASLGLSNPRRRTVALAVCGALTAAIALSKLNAGGFVLIAFAACFCRFAPRTRTGLVLRLATGGLLPVLPFLLMAPQLGQPAFLAFAWMVSLSLVPFGFLSALDAEERQPIGIASYLLGGLALTSAVLCVYLFQGGGWYGLWHSLVLGTVSFPGAFVLPPRFEHGVEAWLALAAIPMVLCARLRWMAWLGRGAGAAFKLACGLTILALCLGSPPTCLCALPLVWIGAVPGTASKRDLETRTLLALLAVLQALHAYPVAGSHVVLFAFLLPGVGVVTVCDSFRELPASWRAVLCRARWRLLGAAAVLFTLACFHSTWSHVPILARQFRKGVPLDLAGAESIRLPERRAAELQWITKNIEHHGQTLLGIPGLPSFYGWTPLISPVPFYPNTWVLFYDPAQEAKLAQALLASERPCCVRNRGAIEFWTRTRELTDGPLKRAVERDFRVAGAVGEYELLIPSSARPDLLLSVLPEPPSRAVLDRFKTDRAFRLTFPLMPGVHVSRIVVRDAQRNAEVFDSAAEDPAKRIAIVNGAGESLLRDASSDVIDLSLQSDIFMICPASDFQVSADSTLVRAYDETGRVVARLLVPTGTSPR